MNIVATKFSVTAAAAAVAAAAAFAPVVANAAPAVSLPTAPVSQLVDSGFALSPVGVSADMLSQDRMSWGSMPLQPAQPLKPITVVTVFSLQLLSTLFIQPANGVAGAVAGVAENAAAKYPNTAYGRFAARIAARHEAFQQRLGAINVSFCVGGASVKVGPYGSVSTSPCAG